ncbi:MAG: thymidylate synthase [Candidatus Kerfeldbacteria bacterium]|nr:thymidylate synthase [Candidatus Kerfeldbacteria bacterium]
MLYWPFNDRRPDRQYRDLLSRILLEGRRVQTQQNEPALRVIGHQMRFDLANGFPIVTERDLVSAPEGKQSQFAMAIAELCAFLNGAQTLTQMQAFGCGWWKPWVTAEKCARRGLEPGDLGPGSYGAAFRRFPTAEGEPFDQMTHLVEQIRELPHLRTHVISPWIPQYIGRGKGKTQKVVVAPCHGWVHVFVDEEQETLSLHHFQRSADAPVGLVFNLIQYAALTLMLAQVTGYRAEELVFTLSDAHIYRDQRQDVEEMLETTPRRFPTVTLDPSVSDLFAFRPQHFTVSDYEPSLERRMIWTPV